MMGLWWSVRIGNLWRFPSLSSLKFERIIWAEVGSPMTVSLVSSLYCEDVSVAFSLETSKLYCRIMTDNGVEVVCKDMKCRTFSLIFYPWLKKFDPEPSPSSLKVFCKFGIKSWIRRLHHRMDFTFNFVLKKQFLNTITELQNSL
jgi:hypothetical protein